MAMVIGAKEVEDAVIAFYKNPTGKGHIHTWLTQAQHSSHAWNFAFQLLDPSKVSFIKSLIIFLRLCRCGNCI